MRVEAVEVKLRGHVLKILQKSIYRTCQLIEGKANRNGKSKGRY